MLKKYGENISSENPERARFPPQAVAVKVVIQPGLLATGRQLGSCGWSMPTEKPPCPTMYTPANPTAPRQQVQGGQDALNLGMTLRMDTRGIREN